MPELWWSSEHGLMRREDGMFWVSRGGWESLRHVLGTGPDSDPEPADAVRLMPVEDNDRHVISLSPRTWTIKHPLSCRPNLKDCPMTRAAATQLQHAVAEGDYYCYLDQHGVFMIGEEVS